MALHFCDLVHIAGFGYPDSANKKQTIHYYEQITLKSMAVSVCPTALSLFLLFLPQGGGMAAQDSSARMLNAWEALPSHSPPMMKVEVHLRIVMSQLLLVAECLWRDGELDPSPIYV